MRLKDGQLCKLHPENLKRSKDGRCTKCESERRMAYRARNLEKELARRAANRDRENELARLRHAENPEARREDSKRYRANNPEKVKERNALSYHAAVEYHKARVAKWRAENPEKALAKNRLWCQRNKDRVKQYNTKSYAKADKSRRLQKGREWQEANRDKVRASCLKWAKENPDNTALRKARKLRATPAWANDFFIKEAYRLARLRSKLFGYAWHVDHIVPLVNKQVCGLHCESNLQVIPGSSNAAKGNRFWPDMP